ncbi:unknown protein [Azorhizobium caulinodans ORS 571]|uniref:Uncharacterized protein n=1 Tax=Azorhizobium caulinodans (strain ATCC 43989 / DSM 5975 / JCM 20966 / LMG 6465 / NBRC 14845 / NCIMB 13405 / ORS 571) TaxID=438753 RepID=A8IF52_AZOC5|nr:hypothetical protein [Azorhizobium caulinodans]BAF89575.1 unknown protein [Azorhizobium caulinodans ORS 571]
MDEQNQLYLMLGRIDGKLDNALQRQDKHDKQFEALDRRVTALESDKMWLIGAATALSSAIGIAFPYIKDYFWK